MTTTTAPPSPPLHYDPATASSASYALTLTIFHRPSSRYWQVQAALKRDGYPTIYRRISTRSQHQSSAMELAILFANHLQSISSADIHIPLPSQITRRPNRRPKKQ